MESAVNVLERQISSTGDAQRHIAGLQDLAGQLAAVRPEQFSSGAGIGVTSPFEGAWQIGRPATLMTGRRSVIICCAPRSGSWLLAELLEATGSGGRPREYFRPDYEAIYARDWELPAGYSFADFVTAALGAGSTQDGTFGLKLHWAQYLSLLERSAAQGTDRATLGVRTLAGLFPTPTFIRLSRDDTAAQAVSWFRAMRTDLWWDTGDAPMTRSARILPDTPDVVAIAQLEATLINQQQSWRAVLDGSGLPVVDVTYAQLRDEYEATARWLVGRLGLPPDRAPVRPIRLRRQADDLSRSWLDCYLRSREDLLCAPTPSS